MKKLDLLSKIQNYSGHTQDQISFKSIQTAVHGVLVVYICREFNGELVCDQTESKELRFFSLNKLPSNLPPIIERIINEFQQFNLYVK